MGISVARRVRVDHDAVRMYEQRERLMSDAGAALDRASELSGGGSFAAGCDPGQQDVTADNLGLAADAMLRTLRDGLGDGRLSDCLDALADVQRLQRDLRELALLRRVQAMTSVHEGLARLQAAPTMSQLLDMVPAEVCRSCGFERCVMFRVSDSELIPEGVHVVDDPEWAAELLRLTNIHRLPLNHMLIETEMLRRRAGALVSDPANDPRTFKPLVEVWKVEQYVASPVLFDHRVIGFLHADCHFSKRPLDDIDREVLFTFAEGLAYAVERASLIDRMKTQRAHFRRVIASTEAVLDDVSNAGISMVRAGAENVAAASTAAAMFVAPDARIDMLLTRREREVLALMASGSTNAAIASQLVISEGTVKSHVKHILRKLRASNRAEAVSRYMRLLPQRPPLE